MEVVENGVNFTYAPKGKGASLSLKEEMLFSDDESIDYLGTIYSIHSDDNYLYVGGTTDSPFDNRKVWKLDKNLNKIAESISYGGVIFSIASDDYFLYVGGETTRKVWKLNKVAYLYKNHILRVIR